MPTNKVKYHFDLTEICLIFVYQNLTTEERSLPGMYVKYYSQLL